MTRMAALGQWLMREPMAAGMGQGVLSAGLSAYGNLAEENDRNKGDQRMILESLLAGAGGGLAAAKARQLMNRKSVAMTGQALEALKARHPQVHGRLQQAYHSSPLAGRVSPSTLMNLGATSLAAGVGAGIGGSNLAPFLADQAGLLQVPGSWTQRADDWNWDRQIPAEEAVAQAVAQRLAEMGVS